MVHALLELLVELRSIMALIVVRDNDSLAIVHRRSSKFHSVRQKVNLLSILEWLLPLRLWDLLSLIVLQEKDFRASIRELLI